jgi:peptidoglycan/xylan/chitin deacetylase (PgdA/CDA1 family)
MPLLAPSAVATDVRAAERAIRRATGRDPRPWFRCPFGAGTHDAALLRDLARLGYRETRWDVDGLDWQASMTGPRLARSVLAATIERGDGAVVLLHPWTRATGRGLPTIITGLREAGAVLVRLDSLA